MKVKPAWTSVLLVLCGLGAAIAPRAIASDSDEPRDGYPAEFHGDAFDIVAGKITNIEFGVEYGNDRYKRYSLTTTMDMKGSIAEGTSLSIKGEYLPPIAESGGFSTHASVGQFAVFYVRRIGNPREFEFVAGGTYYPFGVRAYTPAVPQKDMPLLAAAFQEMRANLRAPGGAGMPRERARALLHDKNVYLWALACWRLVHQAEQQDIDRMVALFVDPDMTPGRALILEDTLNKTTGINWVLTETQTLQLFRWQLERDAQAKLAADMASPTTAPSK